jgi:hypothetical protein
MIDAAINASHYILLNKKKGTEGLTSPVSYYPEESNRIKDSLQFYYEEYLANSGNTLLDIKTLIFPIVLSDFLSLEINIGTVPVPHWVSPTQTNKKDRSEIVDNTFLRPQNNGWPTIYFTYSGGVIEVNLPLGMSMSQVRIGYLRFPNNVSSGINVAHGDLAVNGKSVIITSPKAVYASVIKLRGEVVTMSNKTDFTFGNGCYDYSEIDIDPTIIDIVANMAASSIANLRAGNLNIGNAKQDQ